MDEDHGALGAAIAKKDVGSFLSFTAGTIDHLTRYKILIRQRCAVFSPVILNFVYNAKNLRIVVHRHH